MNRYQIKLNIDGVDKTLLYYAESYLTVSTAWPEALSIEEYSDNSHLALIAEMKTSGSFLGYEHKGRECFQYNYEQGEIIIKFCGEYDLCYYQIVPKHRIIQPSLFTMSNITEAYKLLQTLLKPVSCIVHSYRVWGEPKLSKPKELKGSKPTVSVSWDKSTKDQCFVVGDDLWIKHRDYFSPSHIPADTKDIGTPLSYRAKKYFNMDKKHLDRFVYADCWGDIVLRNEAWLRFKNVILLTKIENPVCVAKDMIDVWRRDDPVAKQYLVDTLNYERFFEEIIKQI